MIVWPALAELVLPTGTIRRAFRRVALSRCWREQRRLDHALDRLEELYSRKELDVATFAPRPGINTERLRLRRFDGQIFLDRWGVEHDRIGGIFLHKMSAPDPGIDLHDHPWWFASLVLKGGYVEERAASRAAPSLAAQAEQPLPPLSWANDSWLDSVDRLMILDEELVAELEASYQRPRGVVIARRPGSLRTMRLDECHRITELTSSRCWTLVVHGPRRRRWGFFLPSGWVDEHTYDETVRVDRRDLWNEAV